MSPSTHRRAKRAFAGVTALVAVLLLAGPVFAHSPTVTWAAPTDGGTTARIEEPQRIAGTARHPGGVQSVGFALVADSNGACRAAPGTPSATQTGGGAESVPFSFASSFPCNKVYEVEVTVVPTGQASSHQPLTSRLRLQVAMAPPSVRSVAAETSDAGEPKVSLRWDAVTMAPDFAGYEIRRALGDNGMEVIAFVDDGTSFVDNNVNRATPYRYEVVAARTAHDGGMLYSPAPAAAKVNVPALATTTTTTSSTTTPSSGNGSGASGSTTSTTARQGLTPAVPRPAPGSAAPRTATTLDTGYDERLPFKPPPEVEEEGQALALPSADQQVVARIEDEGGQPRETMALVAAGMTTLMGSWALRKVLRVARTI
jgi:hypothetical protein